MRKITNIFLVILLCLGCVTVNVFADDEVNVDNTDESSVLKQSANEEQSASEDTTETISNQESRDGEAIKYRLKANLKYNDGSEDSYMGGLYSPGEYGCIATLTNDYEIIDVGRERRYYKIDSITIDSVPVDEGSLKITDDGNGYKEYYFLMGERDVEITVSYSFSHKEIINDENKIYVSWICNWQDGSTTIGDNQMRECDIETAADGETVLSYTVYTQMKALRLKSVNVYVATYNSDGSINNIDRDNPIDINIVADENDDTKVSWIKDPNKEISDYYFEYISEELPEYPVEAFEYEEEGQTYVMFKSLTSEQYNELTKILKISYADKTELDVSELKTNETDEGIDLYFPIDYEYDILHDYLYLKNNDELAYYIHIYMTYTLTIKYYENYNYEKGPILEETINHIKWGDKFKIDDTKVINNKSYIRASIEAGNNKIEYENGACYIIMPTNDAVISIMLDEESEVSYSVRQNSNGDIVLSFETEEDASLVDCVYFEEQSKTKAGPNGVYKKNLLFNGKDVVVLYEYIENILQLKQGFKYDVHIDHPKKATSKSITLSKGVTPWSISAYIKDGNLFIESDNTFINRNIYYIGLSTINYKDDGKDRDVRFLYDEIVNGDNYAYVSYEYLSGYNFDKTDNYEVTVAYSNNEEEFPVSNKVTVNSLIMNIEFKEGPKLNASINNGYLYIDYADVKDLNSGFLKSFIGSDKYHSRPLYLESDHSVQQLDKEVLEVNEGGLRISLSDLSIGVLTAYTLTMRSVGLGTSKVTFDITEDSLNNPYSYHELEANTSEALNVIKALEENENFVPDSSDLNDINIVLNTRGLEFGTINTMQTWLPYFLGNASEIGIDYSNSVPIKTYVTSIDFKKGDQTVVNQKISSKTPYSLDCNVKYTVCIPSDSFRKLNMSNYYDATIAVVNNGILEEINSKVSLTKLPNGDKLYRVTFSHPFTEGILVLYNKDNTKKTKELEDPAVYAFENDFEGMKSFVDAQLKDGWKVFNKIDDIEQKLYPYYDTDKYLVGVINEGENGYVDVYKVLETNWVEIPEIQATQDTKGNIVISYKDINKVADYNDFLSNMPPELSIRVDNQLEVVYDDEIIVDHKEKTWTLDYGNIFNIADKLNTGTKYNITIVPSLFGVKLDNTKSVDCDVKINKNSPEAKPTGSLDSGVMGVLNSDAKTYLHDKHSGSSITINNISTSFNSDVSQTDIDKYFKSYGLSANNSISLNIYLGVNYIVDGTSCYTEMMPYDYPNKYVDLSINVSLDAMSKLGISKENYSTQEIVVLREHNGEVTMLPATLEAAKEGNTIVSFVVKFKTDKMSLFTIANNSSVVKPSSGNPSASTGNSIPAKKPVVNTVAK